MKTRLTARPIGSAILCGVLCFGTLAYAQGTSKTNNKSGSNGSGDEYPDTIELDPFGGISLWGQINQGLEEKLVSGGTAGGRVTWNATKYFGLELGYNFMVNNVRLVIPIKPGLPSYTFGNQIHYLALNPVFSFAPRGSRIQPFVTAGVGAAQFTPTTAAERYAVSTAVNNVYHSANLSDNLQVGVNYGGGIKFHLSEHFGLRFDARGFWSRNPTFGLPNFNDGGIWIPSKQHIMGFQATMGLVFYLGHVEAPAAPPPPPPPPPAPLNAGTITGAEGTLCQGKPINLHSTASDPAGHTLTYAWQLNGAASGSNSPDFSFTPNNAGDFTVQVTVTDSTNPSRTVTAGPITINVKEYVQPQITSVTASPNALSCAADATGTHTASLSGQATGSACGGNLTYKWTVSEGSVTNDTSPNATFDASSLNFEGGAQGQTKTVTATLTVTDETGKSVSRTTDIAVNCPPQFKRLPDIVFAKNSARVNNCGKRILIDQAAPQAGTTFDIVLVGHRSGDEASNLPATGRGRRRTPGAALDEERARNAAAVLVGGGATCANVDPGQVKIDAVGTDQTSPTQPGLCGTSTLPPTQRERRGSRVTEADANRRVEVYLVPHNGAMPPAVKAAKPIPGKLACPK